MESSSSFRIEGNKIIYKVIGKVNRELLVNSITQAIEDSNFRRGLSVIWDFREVSSIEITQSDLALIRDSIIQLEPVLGVGYRVAYVAEKDAVYGFTRMYTGQSESLLPFEMQSFREFEEAIEWVEKK